MLLPTSLFRSCRQPKKILKGQQTSTILPVLELTLLREGETVGFQFKPKLSAALAALNGASVGLAYIFSQGNVTAAIIWFAISTGVTAGLSYYKENNG